MVGIGQNWSGLVGIGRDWSGLVRISRDWSGLVGIGRDWSGLVEIGRDWSGLVGIGRDWSGLVGIGRDGLNQATLFLALQIVFVEHEQSLDPDDVMMFYNGNSDAGELLTMFRGDYHGQWMFIRSIGTQMYLKYIPAGPREFLDFHCDVAFGKRNHS